MSIFSNYPGDPPIEGRDPIAEEVEIQEILEDPQSFNFDETSNEGDNVWMLPEKIDRVMEIVAGIVDQVNPDCARCEAEGVADANLLPGSKAALEIQLADAQAEIKRLREALEGLRDRQHNIMHRDFIQARFTSTDFEAGVQWAVNKALEQENQQEEGK